MLGSAEAGSDHPIYLGIRRPGRPLPEGQ